WGIVAEFEQPLAAAHGNSLLRPDPKTNRSGAVRHPFVDQPRDTHAIENWLPFGGRDSRQFQDCRKDVGSDDGNIAHATRRDATRPFQDSRDADPAFPEI